MLEMTRHGYEAWGHEAKPKPKLLLNHEAEAEAIAFREHALLLDLLKGTIIGLRPGTRLEMFIVSEGNPNILGNF